MSAVVQELNSNSTSADRRGTPQGEPDPLDSLPWLPFTLSVEIPVVRFTVGDLPWTKNGLDCGDRLPPDKRPAAAGQWTAHRLDRI